MFVVYILWDEEENEKQTLLRKNWKQNVFHRQDGSPKSQLGGLVERPTSPRLSSHGLFANVSKSSMPVLRSLFPKHWAPLWLLSRPTKKPQESSDRQGALGQGTMVFVSAARGLPSQDVDPCWHLVCPLLRPQLEHTATFGLLWLWFQTLVSSPWAIELAFGLLGRCHLKAQMVSPSSNSVNSSPWPANPNPDIQALPWTNPTLLLQTFVDFPLSSYALARPVPSSLTPLPIHEQVLSCPHDCEPPQGSLFLFFVPLHLHASTRLIFMKVNNAHPFLKLLCGMWRSAIFRLKSKLFPTAYKTHHGPVPFSASSRPTNSHTSLPSALSTCSLCLEEILCFQLFPCLGPD